ncbi:MAG TPA: glycosyltransferase, partial [Thermoanaerobaculia bacterium]
ATTQRLLRNQTDLGDAIKPFYGDAAGSKLTSLLRDHILIAAELIDAAKAGDSAKKESATRRWYANADDIAGFLSGANPQHWPAAATKQMMHEHLDRTTKEVVAHLQKDWTADIAAYDRVHVQILSMADMLSSGIEAQFPAKFEP